MAINFSRNTKLYVSTVKSTNPDDHDKTNTFEIKILEGYSFTQDAASQTITLSEAGEKPVRGQKIFNTALNPAEITIPAYVRPYFNGDTHGCLEHILWEAMVGDGTSPSSSVSQIGTNAKRSANYMEANFKNSDKHELLKLYLFFKVDNSVYRVNDFSVNTAEIDFSIDEIGKITWKGQGATIEELVSDGESGNKASEVINWNQNGADDYLIADTVHNGTTEAEFIKNKLSSATIRRVTGTTSAKWIVDYNKQLNPKGSLYFMSLDEGETQNLCTMTVETGTATAVVTQTISIEQTDEFWSSDAATTQDLIDEINYQLNDAVCYIATVGDNAGNLVIEASRSGATSYIRVENPEIANDSLLKALGGFNIFVGVGSDIGGTGEIIEYNVPITSGSLSVSNGITYLTPEELGVVNIPIGSFTGSRTVDGSVTAYLNTGNANTGTLLNDLLKDNETTLQEYEVILSMGGSTNTTRVDFIMNHVHLVIPSIAIQDVVSTEIQFTALGNNITMQDELVVRYYSTAGA